MSMRPPLSRRHTAACCPSTPPVLAVLVGLVLLLSGTLGLHAQDRAPDPVLRNIIVLGLTLEEEALVRDAIAIAPGEGITQPRVVETERRLRALAVSKPLEDLAFRPVQTDTWPLVPATMEYDLVIDFRSPPAITRIRIFPLVPLDARILADACTVRVGDIYEQELVDAAAESIRARAEGLALAGVTVVQHHVRTSNEEIVLGFFVENLDRATLRKVRFDHAGWGNASRIRKFLEQPEPVGFAEGERVTAEKLIEVERVTTELMRSIGYLDARAFLDETKTEDGQVKVTYRIERGDKYRIDDLAAAGEIFPSNEFWRPALKKYDGRSITSGRLREIEESLMRQAQTEGYMAADVNLDLAPGRKDDRLVVTATIDEGTTSSLGTVRVRRQANERGYGDSWYHDLVAPPVRESVLKRQVRVREGEDLNRMVLDDAKRRLWRLGIFDEVEVDTIPTTEPGVRNALIRVTEARTGGLGVSLGFNDQIGPVVRMNFVERNVGGRADQFCIGGWVSASGDGVGGDVSYLDRNWRLGERFLGEEREPSLLYYLQYNEYGFDEYTERRAGGRLRLAYLTGPRYGPWSNAIQARVESVSYDPHRDDDQYEESFESYLATTLAYHIIYDTRDRGDYDSTEGLLFDTGIEIGSADGFLAKLTSRGEYHRRLHRRLGWVTAGEIGFMPYDARQVGIGDRFQSGGLGRIRGFDYRGVGPVDGKQESLHIGGSTMTSLQNELRFIISDSVDIPVFFDMGTLERGAFEFGPIRASTGLGIRVKMPESNQRAFLYYAHGISSERTDEERSIHFGFQFGL